MTDAQAAVDGFLERPEQLSDADVAAAAGPALEVTVAADPAAPPEVRIVCDEPG